MYEIVVSCAGKRATRGWEVWLGEFEKELVGEKKLQMKREEYRNKRKPPASQLPNTPDEKLTSFHAHRPALASTKRIGGEARDFDKQLR